MDRVKDFRLRHDSLHIGGRGDNYSSRGQGHVPEVDLSLTEIMKVIYPLPLCCDHCNFTKCMSRIPATIVLFGVVVSGVGAFTTICPIHFFLS